MHDRGRRRSAGSTPSTPYHSSMGTVPSVEGAAGGEPARHDARPGKGLDPRLRYADEVAQAQFEERYGPN